jgi:hypothetical protein
VSDEDTGDDITEADITHPGFVSFGPSSYISNTCAALVLILTGKLPVSNGRKI